MNIIELLNLRGLDTTTNKIKFVRHQDKRFDVHELYHLGYIEAYQSYQAKPIFECDFIVCFLGMDNSRAKFFGVYRVGESKPASEVPLPVGFPHPQMIEKDDIHYDLEPVPGFEDLIDRVVIDWGGSALAWHQWLVEKEVIEILPKGHVKFPGYLDFTITFDELVDIVNYPEANREWNRSLSEVAGVYLILDAMTGKQYVGSACGQEGIIGRWRQYAKSGHGENQQLKDLVIEEPGYSRNFRFALLQTLSKSLTKEEVIKCEVRWKSRLGTRVFGLNSN